VAAVADADAEMAWVLMVEVIIKAADDDMDEGNADA
jgi:hypothetical protein